MSRRKNRVFSRSRGKKTIPTKERMKGSVQEKGRREPSISLSYEDEPSRFEQTRLGGEASIGEVRPSGREKIPHRRKNKMSGKKIHKY